MAIMLFKLRGVPDDEAADIRALLDDAGIEYYETPASRWGVSMEAIWLQDGSQLEKARALVDEYQQERERRARAEYTKLKQRGEITTLTGRIRERPLLFLLCLGIILFIMYASIMPFLEIGSP